MLKNRELTVQMNKKKDVPDDEVKEESSFEEKVDVVVRVAENLGVKLFAGVCIYILLDTRRQVAVEMIKSQRTNYQGEYYG